MTNTITAKICKLGPTQRIVTIPIRETDFKAGEYVKIQKIEKFE